MSSPGTVQYRGVYSTEVFIYLSAVEPPLRRWTDPTINYRLPKNIGLLAYGPSALRRFAARFGLASVLVAPRSRSPNTVALGRILTLTA
jgi:hypothetical protein